MVNQYSVKNFHARNKIIAGTSDFVVQRFIPEGGMNLMEQCLH